MKVFGGLGAIGGVLVLCAIIPCARAARAQSSVDVGSVRVAVIFDPTILQLDRRHDLEKLIDGLAKSFGAGPVNKTVDVWILGEQMMQRPEPRLERQAQLDVYRLNQDGGQLTQWFNSTVRTELMSAWNSAHVAKNSTTPATCLLTALYCVSTKLNALNDNESVAAIVVSDLLEVCNDWGPVNMEDRLDRGMLGTLVKDGLGEAASRIINLSKLSKLSVIQMPSSHAKTPLQVSDVQSVWLRTFAQLKVSHSVQFYLGQLPSGSRALF